MLTTASNGLFPPPYRAPPAEAWYQRPHGADANTSE